MAYTDTLPPQRRFGQTTRPDAWWVQPLFVFLGFSAFIVYSTWAAFQEGNNYWFNGNGADYLSPFYSPEIFGTSPHAIFGTAAGLVAGLAAQIFPGLPDFVGAGGFPLHLLLLPWRVLQGVLGRSRSIAPSANRESHFSVNDLSRSSCKISTVISCMWL